MTRTLLLAADVEVRSGGWLLVVVIGFVVAIALAGLVVRALLRTLPSDVRGGLRSAGRKNARWLVTGGAILLATTIFAVTSMAPEVLSRVSRRTGPDVQAQATAGPTGAAPGERVITERGTASDPTRVAGPVDAGAATVPVRKVNLFPPSQDLRGMTDDTINVCGHAPLLLGPVLGTKTEDLLVYWRWLNDRGGIHGRNVEMTLEDDRYESAGGVPAAQRCQEKDPFFIFGAIGADVTAPVRIWAEHNRELYFYGFSVKKGSENLRYSYTATIQAEDISRVLADVALNRFAAKKQKVGLVWRNSSNVEPAAIAFRERIKRGGGKIVADIPVQKSQGNYSQEIIELQSRGAEVVYIGDDALSQINMMKQGKTQNYNPNWLVFSFNLQTQTLQEDSLTPPLTGANLGPAYSCHRTTGTYAPYASEIKEFEAAYAKYSPNTDLCGPAGDVAFGTWLGFKAMGQLLEACGAGCTRNRLAGIFEAGYRAPATAAGCAVDFSKDRHHGGYGVNLMEAVRYPDGEYTWRNTKRCVTADG
jgi:ABC-type branched-subunit amino acid transport system substrate-binding protein